jgi:TetR/AcrR family transcriptional regulator of autoinduction and epiphytic fitness
MRALHAEGDLRPTAPRIAQRAGVSLRTIWQQFTDREELLAEAVDRDSEIMLSMLERVDTGEPQATRVEAFLAQRTRILEAMTPSWRAARVHESYSACLRASRASVLALGRAELERVFAPELDPLPGPERQRLTDALHAITIWEFWDSLRTCLGLTPQQALDQVTRTFTLLLGQFPVA